MNRALFLSLFSYLVKEAIKWLEQLLAERRGQGVGGERQEVMGATFGAGTWECLIPKPGELPASYTWAAHEWVKRGNTGQGCRAKS